MLEMIDSAQAWFADVVPAFSLLIMLIVGAMVCFAGSAYLAGMIIAGMLNSISSKYSKFWD